jgi:hypothetical protein
MPRKRMERKERGVFERIPGSDIWWIRYKVDGAEHREKVGRFKDAVDLYRIRRSDALRGAKMPANMKNKGVKFDVIGLTPSIGTSNTAAKTSRTSAFG